MLALTAGVLRDVGDLLFLFMVCLKMRRGPEKAQTLLAPGITRVAYLWTSSLVSWVGAS